MVYLIWEKHKIIQQVLQSGIKCQKGTSLVAAIVVVTLFTSLIMVLATQQWTNANMNALIASEQKAYYVAEAGIEYAIKRSVDLSSWAWTQNISFGDGTVTTTVSQLGDDSVQVVSTAQVGIAAKSHVLISDVIDLRQFSIYIAGGTSGWFVSNNAAREKTNVSSLPTMELDSLKAVALSQGRSHAGNYSETNGLRPASFWSDPGDQSKDASVTYVGGNLTINSLTSGRGIYVVEGDVRFRFLLSSIQGVIYLPNASTSLVYSDWFSILTGITAGGIVGNTGITGKFLGFIGAIYNSTIVNKFYTYCENPVQISRLTWTSAY